MEKLRRKITALLRSERGDVAIDFLAGLALKLFLLIALFLMMIYVVHFYNASYVCRRVVREIETAGEYNESSISSLVSRLASSGLENVDVDVDAPYLTGTRHIQLRSDFTVHLTAEYPLTLAVIGGEPLELRVPVGMSMAGMSEVYWK